MSVPNLPPGVFQNSDYTSVSGLHIQNVPRRQTEPPVNGEFSKPNQQYKEFGMTQKTKNKKNYAYRLLTGIQQVSLFSLLFFSDENIAELQRLIRYNIFSITNFRIDNQSETELILIMRSVYLEFSKIPGSQSQYTSEITRLNTLVLETSLPRILSEIAQQQKYLADIAELPAPMSRGKYDTIKGSKEIRDVSDVIFAQTTNVFNSN